MKPIKAGDTRLLDATSSASVDIISIKSLLKEKKVDVNARDLINNTALHNASQNGNHEVVELLLNTKGVEVDLKNNNEDSALTLAAFKGHDSVVKLLLEKGANVNSVNKNGNSALILAVQNGRGEVANSLIDKGADVNFRQVLDSGPGLTAIEEVAINPALKKDDREQMFSKLFKMGATLEPKFFDNNASAIPDNIKDLFKEYNQPEIIAERDKNLKALIAEIIPPLVQEKKPSTSPQCFSCSNFLFLNQVYNRIFNSNTSSPKATEGVNSSTPKAQDKQQSSVSNRFSWLTNLMSTKTTGENSGSGPNR